MTSYKTNVALQVRIKRLDIYQGSFIWLHTLSLLAAAVTPRRAGPGLGLGLSRANTVRWAVNGLWENLPADEWTPGLIGSVITELLRKENPSQGSHFTFDFYCASHGPISSGGFRGGTERVWMGHRRGRRGRFWTPCIIQQCVTQLRFLVPDTSRTQAAESAKSLFWGTER